MGNKFFACLAATNDCRLLQGLFEGMKAYRRPDRSGYTLFRPEENARRMQHGAERMCMPAPSVEQFVHAIKQTVLANRRWVPPQGKGALYLRPLLMGSGPILGLAPAPEYTFLIYAAPVGNYFKVSATLPLPHRFRFNRVRPPETRRECQARDGATLIDFFFLRRAWRPSTWWCMTSSTARCPAGPAASRPSPTTRRYLRSDTSRVYYRLTTRSGGAHCAVQ